MEPQRCGDGLHLHRGDRVPVGRFRGAFETIVLLGDGTVLTADWEQWYTMSPAAQVRPIAAQDRRLYVALFGKEVGEHEGDPEPDQLQQRELARERQWQALPRELKLAVKRVHENLGHANQPAMLRALHRPGPRWPSRRHGFSGARRAHAWRNLSTRGHPSYRWPASSTS